VSKIYIAVMMFLCCNIVSAYYTGYAEYGLNHTLAEQVLNATGSHIEVTNVVFSNSMCVSMYSGGCDAANFEYWDNGRTRITISMRDVTYDDMVFFMWHEIRHYQQWHLQPLINGFTEEQEQDADEYAEFMINGRYVTRHTD